MNPSAQDRVTIPSVETPELIGEISVRLSDQMIVELAKALGLEVELEPIAPDTSEE